jgi:hypothetical protein
LNYYSRRRLMGVEQEMVVPTVVKQALNAAWCQRFAGRDYYNFSCLVNFGRQSMHRLIPAA